MSTTLFFSTTVFLCNPSSCNINYLNTRWDKMRICLSLVKYLVLKAVGFYLISIVSYFLYRNQWSKWSLFVITPMYLRAIYYYICCVALNQFNRLMDAVRCVQRLPCMDIYFPRRYLLYFNYLTYSLIST